MELAKKNFRNLHVQKCTFSVHHIDATIKDKLNGFHQNTVGVHNNNNFRCIFCSC